MDLDQACKASNYDLVGVLVVVKALAPSNVQNSHQGPNDHVSFRCGTESCILTKLNFAQVAQLQKNMVPVTLGKSENTMVVVTDSRKCLCP